jgi:hypothetical protein
MREVEYIRVFCLNRKPCMFLNLINKFLFHHDSLRESKEGFLFLVKLGIVGPQEVSYDLTVNLKFLKKQG